MTEIPALSELVRETRGRPYTMLILTALAIAVPYLWEHAAWADEVKSVQAQIAQLSYDQKRGNLEGRLQAVESELFNIKQKIAEKERAHQPVDPLNYDRVNTLEIEKGQLERQLAGLR